MGITLLAATSTSKSSSSYSLIIFVILLFGIFYFVMIRPQRNRQRRTVAVQDSVAPGQQVRTTAGMYGTVTAVQDGDVILEVAPGVEVRYMRRAIMDVLSDPKADSMNPDGQGPDSPAGPADEGEPADEADEAQDPWATEAKDPRATE